VVSDKFGHGPVPGAQVRAASATGGSSTRNSQSNAIGWQSLGSSRNLTARIGSTTS